MEHRAGGERDEADTYVIIDEEGIVRGRRFAYNSDTARWLDREVERWLNVPGKDK